MINACICSFATPKPLSKLNATHTTIDIISGINNGSGSVICGYIREAYVTLCKRDADIAAPHPSIRPAERSVPASTISPATPNAIIPLVEAWASIFQKLFFETKEGSAIITPIIIIISII